MYWGNCWGTRGDKVSTLCLVSIRRCRNRFVSAKLYRLFAACSGDDFARQCDRVDHPYLYAAPCVAGEKVKPPTNGKWRRWLDQGSNINSHSLNRLFATFPELNKLYNHPLWEVLGWDSDDSEAPATYLENLRPHCRALESSTYQCRINAHMTGALRVPDWTHLAMPLALLRCSSRRDPQRRWLQEHFSHYLTLASLSPTCQRCFPDLWALIDLWLQAGGLGTGVSKMKWPVSAEAFEYQQAKQQEERDDLMDCGWLPQADLPTPCALAMLWCTHLGGAKFNKQLTLGHSRGARNCPRRLSELMRSLDPRLDVASSVLRARASSAARLRERRVPGAG